MWIFLSHTSSKPMNKRRFFYPINQSHSTEWPKSGQTKSDSNLTFFCQCRKVLTSPNQKKPTAGSRQGELESQCHKISHLITAHLSKSSRFGNMNWQNGWFCKHLPACHGGAEWQGSWWLLQASECQNFRPFWWVTLAPHGQKNVKFESLLVWPDFRHSVEWLWFMG